MTALTLEEARAEVLKRVTALGDIERVPLAECIGRVLASRILADRDYPPVARSVRDGFAVQSASLPGSLRVIGEAKAGSPFDGGIGTGECVEIMTGAPMPFGADAVIMVEHCTLEDGAMTTDRRVMSGENWNPQGSEAKAGDMVLEAGQRIGFTQLAMLATVGVTEAPVHRRPRVAILATGDEIVDIQEAPTDAQVRNSNSYVLAAQVEQAGGEPAILPVARDNREDTRALVERGLEYDLLLLSGGVSAGKYDLVESVLAEYGAEFYFTRIRVQPGQPLVFGKARDRFFFGLPGNPASTLITFAAVAKAAIEKLGGIVTPGLPLTMANLAGEVRVKPGLTRFLPAQLSGDGASVAVLRWTGSSDVPAIARANCFVVTTPDRDAYLPGEAVRVLVQP